jgi:NAD(P)-dependent dehydrogenase (short-subunit alcohol dehydrogenase family)
VTHATSYVGPALCRSLAARGFDLGVDAATPALVADLEGLGATVETFDGATPLVTAQAFESFFGGMATRFGRIDSVALSLATPGRVGFVTGPFLDADVGDLRDLCGYLETTLLARQALLPLLVSQRSGQVLVITSDAGARPVGGWSLYGTVRAAQSHMVRTIALEHAKDGVCINVLGAKNAVSADFPGVPPGAVTDDAVVLGDWAGGLLSETPLRRLGTMNELASFAAALLDGTNRFQTAQYFSFSGGWDTGGPSVQDPGSYGVDE